MQPNDAMSTEALAWPNIAADGGTPSEMTPASPAAGFDRKAPDRLSPPGFAVNRLIARRSTAWF
jgi:hypothetical protein